jgi:hypothetical protein
MIFARDGSRPSRIAIPTTGTRRPELLTAMPGSFVFGDCSMSDNDPTASPTFDANAFLEKDRAFKTLSESIRPANKMILFDALAAAGITSVLVSFDGSGDSGQIEGIDAAAGDQPNELPNGEVEIAHIHWGAPDIERTTLSIRDAIESLAYDFLEQTHGGWENNEGAYGEFTFDVAQRTITLDYNERIETSEYSQHVF